MESSFRVYPDDCCPTITTKWGGIINFYRFWRWSVTGWGFPGSAILICKGKFLQMEPLTQRHSVTYQKTLIKCQNLRCGVIVSHLKSVTAGTYGQRLKVRGINPAFRKLCAELLYFWTLEYTFLRASGHDCRTSAGTASWTRFVPPALTFTNSTFYPHIIFACMCFAWISEQAAIISCCARSVQQFSRWT